MGPQTSCAERVRPGLGQGPAVALRAAAAGHRSPHVLIHIVTSDGWTRTAQARPLGADSGAQRAALCSTVQHCAAGPRSLERYPKCASHKDVSTFGLPTMAYLLSFTNDRYDFVGGLTVRSALVARTHRIGIDVAVTPRSKRGEAGGPGPTDLAQWLFNGFHTAPQQARRPATTLATRRDATPRWPQWPTYIGASRVISPRGPSALPAPPCGLGPAAWALRLG